MHIQLDRDLVFFDLEATGLNVLRDRIVQIACIKYNKKGGEPEEFNRLINPGIPISEEAIKVHGITPDKVRNQPTFKQIADELFRFIGNADLAGYNSNRFDLPMLIEEFARVEIEFDLEKRRTIDVQRIFYKMEPRTLRAAHKYYCGEPFDNAHDAMADVKATIAVFNGQLKMYDGVDLIDDDEQVIEAPIQRNIQALHDFTNDLNVLDATQRLKVNHDGEVIFNFGKYQGQPAAEILYNDRNYYQWMMEKDFSHQVKQIIKKLLNEYEQKKKQGGSA
jgi:DNA polymerase III subunit epsilon